MIPHTASEIIAALATTDPTTWTERQLLLDMLVLLSGSANEVEPLVITADGATPITWPGGTGELAAQGLFGGGTLTLQFSVNGGTTWTAMNAQDVSASLTGSGPPLIFQSMATSDDYLLRLNLSGAIAPNINAVVGRVPT